MPQTLMRLRERARDGRKLGGAEPERSQPGCQGFTACFYEVTMEAAADCLLIEIQNFCTL